MCRHCGAAGSTVRGARARQPEGFQGKNCFSVRLKLLWGSRVLGLSASCSKGQPLLMAERCNGCPRLWKAPTSTHKGCRAPGSWCSLDVPSTSLGRATVGSHTHKRCCTMLFEPDNTVKVSLTTTTTKNYAGSGVVNSCLSLCTGRWYREGMQTTKGKGKHVNRAHGPLESPF